MNTDVISSFYLTLFTIQITVLTLFVAGILALYQIYQNQNPKRDFFIVLPKLNLLCYSTISFIITMLTGVFSWSSSFNHNILSNYDLNLLVFLSDGVTSLTLLLVTLGICVYFFYLIYRTRAILNTSDYLNELAEKISYEELSDYLFNTYSSKPFPFIDVLIYFSDEDEEKINADREKKKNEADIEIANWERRYAETKNIRNPISPYIDFCRSNAKSSSDEVLNTGLPLLEKVIISSITNFPNEAYLINIFLKELTLDFREVLLDCRLALKKRYLDMVFSISMKYLEMSKFDSMIEVIELARLYLKVESNEDVFRHVVSSIRMVTDRYLAKFDKHSDPKDVEQHFGEMSLIVAEITESYLQNLNELKAVPIIEDNKHTVDDFLGEVVEYFATYEDKLIDFNVSFPLMYFDSVEVTSMSLVDVMSRSNSVIYDIGKTKSRYQSLHFTLNWIFYTFCENSIKNNRQDIINFCLLDLVSAIENANEKKLEYLIIDIADALISIGFKIACSEYLSKMRHYGSEPVLEYIANAINKNVDITELRQRRSSIEHSLFDCIHKPDAKKFNDLLIW